jgi:hypothetical protein
MRHVKKFLKFINEAHFDDVDVNLDDFKKKDNFVFVKQKEGYQQRRPGQKDQATEVIEIKKVEQVKSDEWHFEGVEKYRVFDLPDPSQNYPSKPTIKEIERGGITLRVKLSGDDPRIYSVGSHVVEYEVDEIDAEKIFKMCQENDSKGMLGEIGKDIGDLKGMGSMTFESKMNRRKYRR